MFSLNRTIAMFKADSILTYSVSATRLRNTKLIKHEFYVEISSKILCKNIFFGQQHRDWFIWRDNHEQCEHVLSKFATYERFRLSASSEVYNQQKGKATQLKYLHSTIKL